MYQRISFGFFHIKSDFVKVHGVLSLLIYYQDSVST